MTSPQTHERAARRRNKNLVAAALLPLLYLLALPHASDAGLAAGLLAPAGLEAFGHTLLAVALVATRLLTVWVVPPVAAAIFASAVLVRAWPSDVKAAS